MDTLRFALPFWPTRRKSSVSGHQHLAAQATPQRLLLFPAAVGTPMSPSLVHQYRLLCPTAVGTLMPQLPVPQRLVAGPLVPLRLPPEGLAAALQLHRRANNLSLQQQQQ